MEKYDLYHTLNKKVSRKALSEEERDDLLTFLEKKLSPEVKKAIVLLIAEYYRVEEGSDLNSNFTFPCGSQEGKHLVFRLDDVPNKLSRILLKFFRASSKA